MFETPDTSESLVAAIDRRFFAPLRRPRTRRVGVELELPVWNLTPGKATDFAPAAFHAGLAERVDALADLLASDTSLYGHGYGAAELRAIMSRREWPSFLDRDALATQLNCILDLAEEGLYRRGFGEEPLLAPLRRRADTLVSPAREQLERLERGETIEQIATDYATWKETSGV